MNKAHENFLQTHIKSDEQFQLWCDLNLTTISSQTHTKTLSKLKICPQGVMLKIKSDKSKTPRKNWNIIKQLALISVKNQLLLFHITKMYQGITHERSLFR
jgi:hypothetical protein